MQLITELLVELWRRPWRSSLVWPLVMINIVGSIYGFYWYRTQLAETPTHLLVLVPDSPLSTTLFALALLLALCGRRPGLLAALACATTIKYGLWAVGVITHYWVVDGQVAPTEVMLWFSHWGMAMEGFIFLRKLSLSGWVVPVTFLWMIFNDYMDYFHGLHPYLFSSGQINLACWLAAGLTLLAVAGLLRARASNH